MCQEGLGFEINFSKEEEEAGKQSYKVCRKFIGLVLVEFEFFLVLIIYSYFCCSSKILGHLFC